MATLVLNNISKAFTKGTPVVREMNLRVADGEFIVIVGPSGCGKSTTLRLIAGLEAPDTGQVLLDGEDIAAISPGGRNIAMVFQDYALYAGMSVFENIAFPLRMRKLPKDEIQQKVAETAALLNLTEFLPRNVRKLSGGEKQRVAMGRAIVRQPRLFLMDEPLSNLDARLRGQIRREIRRLHRQLGITTVYVTHDQIEALTLADRIIVMGDGVVHQTGTPREIYRRPADSFVEEFFCAQLKEYIAERAAVLKEL